MEKIKKDLGQLHPSNPEIKELILKGLKELKGVSPEKAESFTEKLGQVDVLNCEANASLEAYLVYGTVRVAPTTVVPQCYFKKDLYGDIGVCLGGDGHGKLFTIYNNWGEFMSDVENIVVIATSVGGGALTVTFMNKDLLPIGQYLGSLTGGAAVHTLSSGSWVCGPPQ